MFDDTTPDGQYRNRTYAYNMAVSGLALKALGAVCKNSDKTCATRPVAPLAANSLGRKPSDHRADPA